MLTDDDKNRILQQARDQLAETEAKLARYREERDERLLRGEYRGEWQLPEQEPVRRALTEDECRKIVRDEIAKALKAHEKIIAGGIGQELGKTEAKFREAHAALVTRITAFEQRTVDAGPVLDLRVELARRSNQLRWGNLPPSRQAKTSCRRRFVTPMPSRRPPITTRAPFCATHPNLLRRCATGHLKLEGTRARQRLSAGQRDH